MTAEKAPYVPHPKNLTGYRTLDKIAADPRVVEVRDENVNGANDGLWVDLGPGWNWEGCSSVHEWSVRDLLAAFRDIVKGDPY